MSAFTRPLRATHHCRHYSYERGLLGGPRCAIGQDVSGVILKCLPAANAKDHHCVAREEYTDDERAAWEVSCGEGMERLGKAVSALPAAIPMRSGGYVDCPNCDGQIRYDRWQGGAELACSTEGCCGAHFNLSGVKEWPSRKLTKVQNQ
jgi:hypothetical protein